jgi:hypothetical protein
VFGEVPKIIDRNFVIGFFLPFATFIAVTFGLANGYDLLPQVLQVLKADLLLGTTVLGLATWLGGTILLAVNRDLYGLLEGYGRFNPFRLFAWIERRRFKKLRQAILALDEKYKYYTSINSNLPQTLVNKRARLMQKEVEQFPDEVWLLPTAFGNAIRAFEVYPKIMYGIDDIEGWIRLYAVIPKDYIKMIDDAKAQTDFWVNLWILGLLVIVEYVGVSIYTRQLRMLWIPLVTVVCILIISSRAGKSAIEWGSFVKASYDVFLPKLHKELQFPFPKTIEEEQNLWNKFSQAIIYRAPYLLPARSEPKMTSAKSREDSQPGDDTNSNDP